VNTSHAPTFEAKWNTSLQNRQAIEAIPSAEELVRNEQAKMLENGETARASAAPLFVKTGDTERDAEALAACVRSLPAEKRDLVAMKQACDLLSALAADNKLIHRSTEEQEKKRKLIENKRKFQLKRAIVAYKREAKRTTTVQFLWHKVCFFGEVLLEI
jgi:hypothetical protein